MAKNEYRPGFQEGYDAAWRREVRSVVGCAAMILLVPLSALILVGGMYAVRPATGSPDSRACLDQFMVSRATEVEWRRMCGDTHVDSILHGEAAHSNGIREHHAELDAFWICMRQWANVTAEKRRRFPGTFADSAVTADCPIPRRGLDGGAAYHHKN
jgi:hypothetical protein